MAAGSGQNVPPPEASRRRASGWLRYALIASVACNLLFVGLAAGAAYRFRHFGPFGEPSARGLMGLIARAEPERRAVLRDMIEEKRPEVHKLRQAAREARDAAFDVLASKPFDETAFKAAHDRMFAAETRAREASLGVLTAIAGQLTDEERERLATWRKRGRRSHR